MLMPPTMRVHTYYFGASTITLGQIHEMAKKGYFVEGEARVAGE
jgi:hypothetical protein